MWLATLLWRAGILSDLRWRRLNTIAPDVCHWDLRYGIPFPGNTFDIVYHGHLFEHLPKEAGPGFIQECFRVCKPGGIIRVVVPDLEYVARSYLEALTQLDGNEERAWDQYDSAVHELFDQMVRERASGMREQKKWLSVLEAMVRGAVNRTSELYCWMYDRHSLRRLLNAAGFIDVRARSFDTGAVPFWNDLEFDQDTGRGEYTEHSLYLEGRAPK